MDGETGLRQAARQVRRLRDSLRAALSPHYREIARLRRDEAEHLFQPFPTTAADRYPRLFDALAQRLAGLAEPRILSLGCSSGEEVRALRRRMPQARIVGLDLNQRMIAQARGEDSSLHSDYRCASAPGPGERFDAVLALAVFRHGDLRDQRPQSCAAILPFARFDEGLAMLDRHLETGGWLALANHQFRFADSEVAARYHADSFTLSPGRMAPLVYGRDDRRIEGASESAALFQKRAEPPSRSGGD